MYLNSIHSKAIYNKHVTNRQTFFWLWGAFYQCELPRTKYLDYVCMRVWVCACVCRHSANKTNQPTSYPAMHCNTLQHLAIHGNTLQHVDEKDAYTSACTPTHKHAQKKHTHTLPLSLSHTRTLSHTHKDTIPGRLPSSIAPRRLLLGLKPASAWNITQFQIRMQRQRVSQHVVLSRTCACGHTEYQRM